MKKIFASASIIVLFALIVVSFVVYAYLNDMYTIDTSDLIGMSAEEIIFYLEERQSNASLSPIFLIPLLSFGGIFIGLLVFYIMSGEIEKKQKKEKTLYENILKFLPDDEKAVMKELIEKGGKANQYEISRLPNMNKVKAHRAIEKLLKRGVIKKEGVGKINRIILAEE